MRTKIILLFIFLCSNTWGQTSVAFTYDLTGNRTSTLLSIMHADSLSKSIDNKSQSAGISVYPVPAKKSLFVKLKSESFNSAKATIYSINGILMMSSRIEKRITEIDITRIPSGIYFLKVYCDDEIYSWKIIKLNPNPLEQIVSYIIVRK